MSFRAGKRVASPWQIESITNLIIFIHHAPSVSLSRLQCCIENIDGVDVGLGRVLGGRNGREKRNLPSPCPAFIFIKLQWLIELALDAHSSCKRLWSCTRYNVERELDSGEAFAAHVTEEGRPEAVN